MKSRRIASFWVMLAIAVLGMTAISGTSSAHLPIYTSGGSTIGTALKIPDASTSYGITAEFPSSTDRIQFYAFSVYSGQNLSFELNVPAISSLQDFAPVILLIGPGLHSPDSNTSRVIDEFNITMASGYGATIYLYNGTENVRVFEPFTQTNLWVRQSTEVTLPSEGVYYLAVAVPRGWSHDATSGFGKYVLAPGTAERFTLLDYMSIPISWVKWHAFWGQSVLLLMAPTFLVVIVGVTGTWYYLKNRHPEMLQSKPNVTRIGFYLGAVGAMLMVGSTVNQMALLFGYTRFSLETADYIELMLQAIGLVLGIIAFRMAFSLMRPESTASKVLSIALLVVIGFAALTVGAGWLVGPVLFASAGLAELLSANRSERKSEASGR